MTNQFSIAGLQSILGFPFRDPRWKEKLLIASLLGFGGFIVPILPWLFLAGYFALIIRRITAEGGDPYLPEWQDWSRLLEEGFRLSVVAFLYMLPTILLALAAFGLFFLPFFALAVASGSSQNIPSDAYFLPFISQFGGMAAFGLVMLVGIVSGVVTQAAICHAATRENFAAGFRFGEWWPIFRANLGGFILTYVLVGGLSYVVSFVFQILYMTIILCMLIPVVMAVFYGYFGLISSVLFAEAYREGQEKLAAS